MLSCQNSLRRNSPPIATTHPETQNPLEFTNQTVVGELYNSLNRFSLRSTIHSPLTTIHLSTNISWPSMFSNIGTFFGESRMPHCTVTQTNKNIFSLYTYTYRGTQKCCTSFLFSVYPPPPEARPLTFLTCVRRGKDKQVREVISMDRFTLEHRMCFI
jgi:hypothetical protein